MPTHTLGLRTPVSLDRETTMRVESITVEQTGPSPDGSGPSGSGVEVVVIFQRGSYEREVDLDPLSAGYDSRSQGWFEDHRVTLLDVADPLGTAKVSLLLERVTKEPDGPPTQHRVKKKGTIEIDADTRLLFTGHGHKRVRPGQASPLMVSVDWMVQGQPAESQSVNVGPQGGDMTWTWRRWRLTVGTYDYDAWMELTVQALALARVESDG